MATTPNAPYDSPVIESEDAEDPVRNFEDNDIVDDAVRAENGDAGVSPLNNSTGHTGGGDSSSLDDDDDELDADKQNNDDDDITVIVLDQDPDEMNSRQFPMAWNEQAGPQVEERRRTILLRELQRVQRTSFLHFLILCLIPTVLLFIVIATVVSEDEECSSEATFCAKEERNFINAFTMRCVCDAIAVPRVY